MSHTGLKPDPAHVVAVSEAPPPKDVQSLRSFLGLTSWYAKFIPNYALVVEPLKELLRGPSTFSWSVTAQQSFDSVKELIVSSPALALN